MIFSLNQSRARRARSWREGRRGKYVTKRKGVETVKLFGSDDVTRMPRKSISVRMQNFLSSRFPFVIVGFLEFERRISIR